MANSAALKDFRDFSIKIMIAQTLTYFMLGLIMSKFLNYGTLFGQEIIKDYMRPIDSLYVLAGPFLQPVRGFLFALALWPIRDIILVKKQGWLILWGIFIVFGILSTPAAAPSSIEGVIYSKLPLSYHLLGLPEILLQTLAFSLLTIWWLKRPHKKEVPETLSRPRAIFLRIIFAVMIGCFGYIGYAIGGILSAMIAGFHINLSGEALDFKRQLMFVFALVINIAGILILSSKAYFNKISLPWIFVIFWGLDTLSPLIYQAIFLHAMPIHLALVLGFFPALIIAFSYKMNYKNYALLNGVKLGE